MKKEKTILHVKRIKGKTVLQAIADWLAINGGGYKEKFRMTCSDTVLVIGRQKKIRKKGQLVSVLHLSTRVSNLLKENKILTVQSLVRCSGKKLLDISGMGISCVKEIKKELSRHELYLRK